MSKDRMTVVYLGRILGTASGWDGDNENFWFFDFIPAEGVPLTPCSLYIDTVKGEISAGEDSVPSDIPTLLAGIPRM